jgi:hypothetical protein
MRRRGSGGEHELAGLGGEVGGGMRSRESVCVGVAVSDRIVCPCSWHG